MFKYLSEILSKFTPQQRLLALGLLLFTAILLGLGNSLINSYNQSDSVLSDRVKRLEISQAILLRENDSLYNSLSNSQIQCSRDIMDVRRKILEDLGILESHMMEASVRRESVVRNIEINRYDGMDTIVMASPMIIEETPFPSELLNEVRNLKSKIKNDIQ
jgi:hypothetical protein